MAFFFGFSGDDLDVQPDPIEPPTPPLSAPRSGAKADDQASASGAFPVAGCPQLPPKRHDLAHLLSCLPSKMAFKCIEVELDDGSTVKIPRRELWDIRLQLMAEDDGCGGEAEALGKHDVKTGVYEGGFKSWESSVDLVKVLAARDLPSCWQGRPARVIELGCGTALPSLALFLWVLTQDAPSSQPITFILADYNPSVLQLVTLPNLVLAWAFHRRHVHAALRDAFSLGDELELGPEILQAFQTDLSERNLALSFLSGAWSREFVQLVYDLPSAISDACASSPATLLLGAETIYSPLALRSFTEVLFTILTRERAELGADAAALVAAKKHYFGVGGSLDDFKADAEGRGGRVTWLREEAEGVRRGVVHCVIQDDSVPVGGRAT